MRARRIRVAIAIALCAAPWQIAAAQQATVDTLASAFIRRHNIPGATIAAVRDGKTVVSGAYGIANLELNARATRETVFEIGSISKLFTAAAAMRLVEQGAFALGDPITRYVPDLPATYANVTVGHLLTHTGGVPDWESRTAFSYRGNYSVSEFVRLIAPLALDFTPGERFAYTNSGAPLLGIAIGAVSGIPFEAFVRSQLLDPAGLTRTRFKHQGEIVAQRSGGYVDSAGTFRNGEPHRPEIIAPSGGMLSTAEELALWMYKFGAGTLLNPMTVAKMLAPVRLNNGVPFSAGMGIFLDAFRGRHLTLHNGSTVGGFSSVVYWYPDDRLAVAVLFNVDRFNAVNTLATRVAGAVIPGLSIASMPEKNDPDPALAQRLLAMLRAVAERRDSDLLASNLRVPGAAPRTNASFGFVGTPDRFAFLEREDMGAEGASRFGNVIRWIYRYRLVAGERTIDYTFETTTAGTIARFLAERQ